MAGRRRAQIRAICTPTVTATSAGPADAAAVATAGAADRPVTLVTGDSGARINARVSGMKVLKLARDDLLPRYRPELAEAAKSTEA